MRERHREEMTSDANAPRGGTMALSQSSAFDHARRQLHAFRASLVLTKTAAWRGRLL
jgi:hypothetical protein